MGGLSSISIGGRGASVNIRDSRSGKPRSTVGLPGTGLRWSIEQNQEADRTTPARHPAGPAEGLPNSRRFRPGQLDASKQECQGVLQVLQIAPGSHGRLLWELNLITRLLVVIETPEAMEAYLMRAQSHDDAKRQAHRCVEAAQHAARLVNARGWLHTRWQPGGSAAAQIPQELIADGHRCGPVLRFSQPRTGVRFESVVSAGDPAHLHLR